MIHSQMLMIYRTFTVEQAITSFKIIRFIILIKIILRELTKLVHPRAIFHVKVGEKTISPDDLSNVAALTFLFIGISALMMVLFLFENPLNIPNYILWISYLISSLLFMFSTFEYVRRYLRYFKQLDTR